MRTCGLILTVQVLSQAQDVALDKYNEYMEERFNKDPYGVKRDMFPGIPDRDWKLFKKIRKRCHRLDMNACGCMGCSCFGQNALLGVFTPLLKAYYSQRPLMPTGIIPVIGPILCLTNSQRTVRIAEELGLDGKTIAKMSSNCVFDLIVRALAPTSIFCPG